MRPPNPPNRQSFGTPTRKFRNSSQKPSCSTQTPETQKPRIAGLSFESWRETRDSNPGNAINVRRFSRPLCKFTRADGLKDVDVPLLKATDQATGRILQGVRFEFGNSFCPPPASRRMHANHGNTKGLRNTSLLLSTQKKPVKGAHKLVPAQYMEPRCPCSGVQLAY